MKWPLRYRVSLCGAIAVMIVLGIMLCDRKPDVLRAAPLVQDTPEKLLRHEMAVWLGSEARRSLRLKRFSSARMLLTSAQFFEELDDHQRLLQVIAEQESALERLRASAQEVMPKEERP